MTTRTLLPGALKAIREAKAQNNPDYKLGKFAATCLVSTSHLCNIEAGRKRVSEELIHRFATHLGVPTDAISYTTALEAVA